MKNKLEYLLFRKSYLYDILVRRKDKLNLAFKDCKMYYPISLRANSPRLRIWYNLSWISSLLESFLTGFIMCRTGGD